MAATGNARNNLSNESQRYFKSLDAEVKALRKEMDLFKSQKINSQINRLATGVGNSIVRVVPLNVVNYSLTLSGLRSEVPGGWPTPPTGLTLWFPPPLDMRYSIAVVSVVMSLNGSFSTSAVRSRACLGNPYIMRSSGLDDTFTTNSPDATGASGSGIQGLVPLSYVLSLSDVTDTNWALGTKILAMDGDMTSGWVNITGSITYFKENS